MERERKFWYFSLLTVLTPAGIAVGFVVIDQVTYQELCYGIMLLFPSVIFIKGLGLKTLGSFVSSFPYLKSPR